MPRSGLFVLQKWKIERNGEMVLIAILVLYLKFDFQLIFFGCASTLATLVASAHRPNLVRTHILPCQIACFLHLQPKASYALRSEHFLSYPVNQIMQSIGVCRRKAASTGPKSKFLTTSQKWVASKPATNFVRSIRRPLKPLINRPN